MRTTTQKTRTATCDGCGMKRKLTCPTDADIRFYGLCSECFPKVKTQEDVRKLRRDRPPRPKSSSSKKAYPCIGGPLDGQHAISDDFHTGGMYENLMGDYASYNNAGYYGRNAIDAASMIWVHKSVLQPAIRPSQR